MYLFKPGADKIIDEEKTRTPSERAGQKSDQDARHGGLAARADPFALRPLQEALPDSAKVKSIGFFLIPSGA